MATIENPPGARELQIDRTLQYFACALARVEQLTRELEHEGVEPDVVEALRIGERHLGAVQRHLAGAPLGR
jgi:hypothetical protein